MKNTDNLIKNAALAFALVAGLPLHADVVSWNKDAYGTIPESGTDTAGVVNAAWWNNSWPDADQDTVNLQDSTNNPTTIDLTLTQPSVYQIQNSGPALDADGTHNKRLLNGYMNAGTGQGGGVTSIAISQIPYTSYAIHVYFSSDVAGRIGTVTDGSTTYEFSTVGAASISSSNAMFTQTTTPSGTGTNPAANYAVFSGLTGASKTVTVNIPTFGGIAGIQIEGILPVGPEFVEHPQPANQLVAVNGSASFTATAAGVPAPTYQWEYSVDNGTTAWAPVDGQALATLNLSGVTPEHEGYYRVVATNTNSSVPSQSAFLDVFYAPPTIFTQPADINAVEGSTVQLSVVASGYETLTYQWYKDTLLLGGETSDTLVLSAVDSNDAGVYFVEITDSVDGGKVSNSNNATVAVFPAWNGLASHDAFASGYTLGELPLQNPAVTGYTGAWTDVDFGDAEPEVMAGSLTYADPLYLGSSGDSIGKAADAAGIGGANSGRVYRKLAPALAVAGNTTGTRYLAWLYRTGNENAAVDPHIHSVLSLYQNTGGAAPAGDAARRVFEAGISSADFGNTNFGFRYNDFQVGDLGVAVDAEVHLFVVKFDLSATEFSDSITVWIDPALGSGEPAGGMTLTDLDVAFDSLAFSDYASNSVAWDELRWGSSFNSVTLNAHPPANFAAWIAAYPGVGSLNGFNDDPDHDGIPNGLENVFGTNPGSSNPGISSISRSGNAVTFQHPQNTSVASDVTVASLWSTDLAQWHASGATSGGTKVDFTSSPNNPSAGITTVTGAISGTVPAGLFVRMKAVQAAP